MVLVGQVGRELVGLINEHGPFAVGCPARTPACSPPAPAGVRRRRAGRRRPGRRRRRGQRPAVTDLIEAGRIPVVSTVAPDADGVVHNVNADTAAAALAVALGARKLVVLTDVEGLYANWPDRDSLLSQITADELAALLPTLDAGMVPKMEACLRAVRGGVPRRARGRRPGAALHAAGGLHHPKDSARWCVRRMRMAGRTSRCVDRWPQVADEQLRHAAAGAGRAARARSSSDEAGNEYVDLLARHRGQRARPRATRRWWRRSPRRSPPSATSPTSTSPSRRSRWPSCCSPSPAGRAGSSSATRAPRRTRPRSSSPRRTGRTQVVAAVGGFHGRTMGALALTGQPAKADPFRPLPGEVIHVPVRRRGRAGRRGHRRHRDGDPGADPGRGRRGGAPARLPRRRPGDHRPARRAARRSTRCRPASAAPATGSPTRPRASRRTSSPWPRASAAGCRSAPAWPSPTGCPTSPACAAARAATAAPSAATRSAAPPALAVLRTIAAEGLLDHVKRVGERLRRGIEALGHPLVAGVRGAGLLLGVVLRRAGRRRRGRRRLRDAGFLVNPVAAGRGPARPAADPHRRAGRRVPRRAAARPCRPTEAAA